MKSLTYLKQAADSPAMGLLQDFEQFRQSIIGKPFTVVIIYDYQQHVLQLYDWFLDHYLDTHNVKINKSCQSIVMEGQNQYIIIRLIHWRDPAKLLSMHDIDFIALHTMEFLQMLRRLLMATTKYGCIDDDNRRSRQR